MKRRMHTTTTKTNVSLTNFNLAMIKTISRIVPKSTPTAVGGSPGKGASKSPLVRAFCRAFSRLATMSSIIIAKKVHMIDRRMISALDHWSIRNASSARHSSSHHTPYLYNRSHMFQPLKSYSFSYSSLCC